MAKPMIEADRLTKHFGDFVAIRDVSFSIPAGQVVAFLGPNGAGKSTTLRILTGYFAPTSGKASIAGLDAFADRRAASELVGYLPENGPLYDDMTPADMLKFLGQARGLSRHWLRQRISEVAEICDLHTVLRKPISKLSRGFRQRVGMASALLHEPEILIMDEPTAGLDPNQIREVRYTLRMLGKEKTILVSTHIFQEVEAVADRVLVISAGSIAFDGTPEEFRAAGNNSMDLAFYDLTRTELI